MSQRVNVASKLKSIDVGGAKASFKRANKFAVLDPKPVRSSHEQVEVTVTRIGGPNPLMLQN